MKKTILSAIAFVAIAAVGCKKDDNTSASRSQMLVGSWKTSFEADDANNNKTLDQSERMALSNTDTGSVTFNTGGSGSIVASGFSLPLTWAFYNNDQQIILNTAFGADTGYIHTLTSSELIIEDRSNTTYSWSGFTKK